MNSIKKKNSSILALSLLLLTACSVTDYKVPISDFAKATQDSEQALIALNQQVTDASAAVQRRRILDEEGLARLFQTNGEDGNTVHDCQVTSARCRIAVVDRAGQQELLSPELPLRNMVVLMGGIRAYAEGLVAIVNAETAQNVTTQVNATLASVEDLAATVAKLENPASTANPVSEFRTPVGNAVNWIVGQYVASVQLEGLRRATKDAKPVIAQAAGLFEGAAAAGLDVPRRTSAEEVSTRVIAIDSNLTESTLDQLIASAAAYDELLLADPPTVFVRMREAHDALADKLQDQDLSMADVLVRIKAFLREAETLKDIVKALAAAAGPKVEG